MKKMVFQIMLILLVTLYGIVNAFLSYIDLG